MKKFYLFFFVSFLISFNANAQVPSYVPTIGLVSWYPFNGNANDASVNGKNGTIYGGVTLTTDRFNNPNNSYNFNGTTGAILADTFYVSNNFTASFWYLASSSINLSASNTQSNSGSTILCKGGSNSPCNYADFAFGFKNGYYGTGEQNCTSNSWLETELGWGCNYTYVSNCNSNISLQYNWTNLTIVLSSGYLKRYSNGVLIDSITYTAHSGLLANSGYPLSIGGRYVANCCILGFWNGKLDDIGIWNRALTAQEIADLYIGCPTPVTITTQPTSQTVCENTLASFNVTATGAGTLAYQWYKNGTSIAGATNSSYAIASAAITDTGRYSVKITSSVCGEKISQVAVLSVGKQAKVLTQPINKSLCGNASASFSVVASGAGTLTYQWKKDGVNITGANASNYIIANAKVNDEGLYSCLVTSSSCGNELSSEASLTIPHFTTQPTSQTVSSGMNVTFNVAHSQTNATYQWQSDLGFGFQNLSNAGQYSGATTKQLTITGVTASNKNQLFRCIVSSSPCVDTSTTSTIYVTTAGINTKANNHGIQLQPNPASEYIRITVEANLVGAAYTVLNENGKVIMKGVIAEENTTLSLRDFASGVYLFRIGNSSVQTFKVVKK